MLKNPQNKYQPIPTLNFKERTWPNNTITKPPIWCSVDLRDGNQALIWPMTLEEKLKLFKLLVTIGFKQIEVGFPAAADVEYQFLRTLIDNKLIPKDVTIQVLTQAREQLVRRTFEAIEGAKNVIVHVYNSISIAQRDIVFRMSKKQVTKLATDAVKLIRKLSQKVTKTNIQLEYSPESFTGTEVEYALDVCEAVVDVWEPKKNEKIILNLPATVEMYTPNVYADQIEWFIKNLSKRNNVTLSLHTHNDRGTGIAATELALLAGADRVEGTLFGNGERTGNVDIVTLALNLYTQGVHPNLDFSNINTITRLCNEVTKLPIHERHPYVGELVYTAFSGSHQDAIKKGMSLRKKSKKRLWDVPYLPIDPEDINRSYEAIIRINSQSGKGGVAYILEAEYGYNLPKTMHSEFALVIQKIAEKSKKEVPKELIYETFEKEYLDIKNPLEFLDFFSSQNNKNDTNAMTTTCELHVAINRSKHILQGTGNGPIDACQKAITKYKDKTGKASFSFNVLNYQEHSLTQSSKSQAIAYVQIKNNKTKTICYGVGIDANITTASIKALISALNRSCKKIK